jgi:aspartate/methionine/tyrosine aminotransferase
MLLAGSSFGRGGEGYVRAALTIEPGQYVMAADRIAGAR